MPIWVHDVNGLDLLNREVPVLTVVGTGLVGASVGLGLRAAGFLGHVIGVGRRDSTVRRALKLNCIDEATTDLAAAASRSRLLLLATPLSRFAQLFEQIGAHAGEDLVITDAGSTKQQVCADARRILDRPGRFVGAHPMAGSEQQGPEAARADLFRGGTCVVTPEADTDTQAIALVESLWRSLGMVLLRMTPQEHDRQTAVISHLPHVVAALLVGVANEQGGWPIASTGFRDTTRLASSNPPMRADIMLANREALVEALDVFAAHLQRMKGRLADADGAALLDWLTELKKARDRWLDEH